MTYMIVDIDGLAKVLKASRFTLKKNWRSLPHFFIGDGRNLKGARFDVSEVIEHLKKEARHVSMERCKKESLDSKIHAQQQTVQEGGFRELCGDYLRREESEALQDPQGDTRVSASRAASLMILSLSLSILSNPSLSFSFR